MLSISTSWMNQGSPIEDWLKHIKSLGFGAVELSYKVDHEQLEEFRVGLPKHGIKVSSIHNFCPTPNDEPSPRHLSNYFRLSSIDEHERQQAVKWTKIAVDTAESLDVGVVVIHAGVVSEEDERSPALFELYSSGKKNSEAFKQELDRTLNLRLEKRAPYLAAIEKSLEDVLAYSNGKNVKIGLETRYYPLEMPNFEEIGSLLKQFVGKGLYYWHDVGHADMNDRLGITAHEDFLKSYQDYLIGVHIHGIEGRRDHKAPFEGDMDLEKYLPYFKDCIKVVESKPFASEELIAQAVNKLKSNL